MDWTAVPQDAAACYDIVRARDARYDGVLFVGVTSTGVYCRPICRVRLPRPENCRYFVSAARAESERFRPCMKCRPEIAPGSPWRWSVMDASRTLATQAASALDDQLASPQRRPVAAAAAVLGVTDRHLRRIFAAEHGVTPLQYLLTRRLLAAKQLLADTDWPVTQIAHASGFASVRRFNACFAGHYGMSPTRLRGRRSGAPASPGSALCVQLAYRPPYDIASQLRFLARRAVPGVEQVTDGCVRRTVPAGLLGAAAGWIEVAFRADIARVQVRFPAELGPAFARVIAATRRWLDLDAAPSVIDAALDDLPGAPGLRLPGCIDPFELVVRAILGQQVSVAAARTLADRLVRRFGTVATTPWSDLNRQFPTAPRLAAAAAAELGTLGILPSRAQTIVTVASAWPQIAPCLLRSSPVQPLVDQLLALPGIGRWTAHYVAMRTLGWTDAFLVDDVAVLKAMRTLFRLGPKREVNAHARSWQPWRGYAVLRLWNSLEAASPAPP